MRAADRLDVIWAEGRIALTNLQNVLKFIDGSKPEPAARVVMVNSVIVATVSTVEEIIRQLFIEYLSVVEERLDSHKKLRGKLRDTNAEKTVDELRKLVKDKNEIEAVKLLDALRRCLNGDPGYRIAKDVITHNKGNFRSEQLTEIAKQIGFSDVWAKIADDASVNDYTGMPSGAACTGKLIKHWNDIYDERDIVVHRISQASGWATSFVAQSVELFVLVLNRFTKCLTDDLISVIPPEQD